MILHDIAAEMADDGKAVPRVLVVDDDPTSRLLARAALKDRITVVEAENGQVAVETLERESFDLAVLDLDMPVVDGFGVIGSARARPESRYMPIIVVTGRDDVVSIERAFALGATSFLCKPISWNVFPHQVGYVLKVAQVERRLRIANKRLERVAALRARGIAALRREIGNAVESIKRGSDGAAALPEILRTGKSLAHTMARVDHACDVLGDAAGFAPRAVKASDLAAASMRRLEAEVGAAEAGRIAISIAGDAVALCDCDLVSEALAEILKNALEASRPSGKVRLGVVDVPPDRVRFEIADEGPGIPEYVLESGIDELASEDAGSAQRWRPGLGLALAKSIVDKHGGHFGIMSEPGQGTEVFLSFSTAAHRAAGQPGLLQVARDVA
jgi:CheY-like chemotaxis protein